VEAGAHREARRFKAALSALIAILVLFCLGGQAQAALLEVTTRDENAPQGLATRIDEANATEAADKIFFSGEAASGTISLTEALPTIEEPLTIEGPGAGTVKIYSDGTSRILAVNLDAPGVRDGVSISGLNFENGNAGALTGGAIRNVDGRVTIDRVFFTGNSTDAEGGAIESTAGSIAVTDSKFILNKATHLGGAILIEDGTATIQRTIFDGNAGAGGSGVSASSHTIIEDSTFTGNGASAVALFGDQSVVRRSTFSGNHGGETLHAYSPSGPVRVESSTVTGNAGIGVGASSSGSGRIEFADLTIAGNGGAGVHSEYGITSLDNSLVSGNGGSDVTVDPGEPAVSTAYSLISSPGLGAVQDSVPGTNIFGGGPPLIGQLSENGGPTRTMLLLAGSPAVDKGRSSLGSDQRGLTRINDGTGIPNAPGGNGADIGAVEIPAVAAPPKKKCKKAKKRKKGKKAQAAKKKKAKKCKKKKKKKGKKRAA
jgi:predicted outer membrane repeat protein